MKISGLLKKAHDAVYKLLGDSGRQGELRSGAEYVVSAAICLNVLLIIAERMEWSDKIAPIITALRTGFFVFFLIEYILRLWVADVVMHDKKHPVKSRLRYMVSFMAIIDLLALLPVMTGATLIDFRIFRILKLLRLTRIKSLRRYTEAVEKVIKLKGAQLLASLFIVFVFMLASAVIIYDLEAAAQPGKFTNVLDGLWWSISAVTTIGYGDMCPVTPMGRTFSSIMSILGIFLMAIPVAILTSGFFEVSKSKNELPVGATATQNEPPAEDGQAPKAKGEASA